MKARMPKQPELQKEKLRELILHIAKRSEGDVCFGMIKLNKLLFFADFLAYMRLGKPITGEEYQKLDNGPAPRRVKPLLDEMKRGGALGIQHVDFHGFEQQRAIALREPIYGQFSRDEILLVDDLVQRFRNMTAAEISDLSHKFVGWRAVKTGETIPYGLVVIGFRAPTDEEKRYGLDLESLAQQCLAP